MKITVFTPTYNRAYRIETLYRSLQRQTSLAFEWIVIDDGSTDNTDKLFSAWLHDGNRFKITYKKTKNCGKHAAINEGVKIASGELFFIVDSDDYLTDNAIEQVIFWAESIKQYGSAFGGVSGNRGYDVTEIIGTTFEGKFKDTSYVDRASFKISGDKAEAYFTEILREIAFPIFGGENFIQEDVVWLKIGQKYKLRYFNEIIYIGEYLDNGLSANGEMLLKKNPKGRAQLINTQIEIFKYSLHKKISTRYNYYCFYKNNISVADIANNLKISKIKLYIIVVLYKLKGNK